MMTERCIGLRPSQLITIETPDGDVTVRADFSLGRDRRDTVHVTWPDSWGGAEIISSSTDLEDTHPGE